MSLCSTRMQIPPNAYDILSSRIICMLKSVGDWTGHSGLRLDIELRDGLAIPAGSRGQVRNQLPLILNLQSHPTAVPLPNCFIFYLFLSLLRAADLIRWDPIQRNRSGRVSGRSYFPPKGAFLIASFLSNFSSPTVHSNAHQDVLEIMRHWR